MNEIILLGENKNEFIIRPEALKSIAEVESKIKELKKAQEDYKKQLLQEMEDKGIFKIESEREGVTVSYTEAREDLEVFNKDKFREENPDLYDKYVTLDGKKKAYITIRTNDRVMDN